MNIPYFTSYMKWLFGLITLLLFTACAQRDFGQRESAQIKELLTYQQKAWNEGDIEAFMEVYWQSDSLIFFSSGKRTYGWDNTLENYKLRYPNRDAMGQLTFSIYSISGLGKHACSLLGGYHLQRKDDELEGYFTLIWQKLDGQWKIVSDMTCAE